MLTAACFHWPSENYTIYSLSAQPLFNFNTSLCLGQNREWYFLFCKNNISLTKANNMVHIWPRCGNGMGCFMVDVCFYVDLVWANPMQATVCDSILFCYRNAMNFVKFHISPIGYDMVMAWFGPITIPCNF